MCSTFTLQNNKYQLDIQGNDCKMLTESKSDVTATVWLFKCLTWLVVTAVLKISISHISLNVRFLITFTWITWLTLVNPVTQVWLRLYDPKPPITPGKSLKIYATTSKTCVLHTNVHQHKKLQLKKGNFKNIVSEDPLLCCYACPCVERRPSVLFVKLCHHLWFSGKYLLSLQMENSLCFCSYLRCFVISWCFHLARLLALIAIKSRQMVHLGHCHFFSDIMFFFQCALIIKLLTNCGICHTFIYRIFGHVV